MSQELGRLTFEMFENGKCIPRRRLEEVTHRNVNWAKERENPRGIRERELSFTVTVGNILGCK